MPRPLGAKQYKPTEQESNEYYALLKQKANAGDTNAAGWLLHLDSMKHKTLPFKIMGGQLVEIRG